MLVECGLLLIGHAYRVEFGTFDILEDDEVRQGLKKYSNWPTYPQLYVKGEFIGGLDIVKVRKQLILMYKVEIIIIAGTSRIQ